MDAYRPRRFALTGATGALGLAFLRRMLARDPQVQATLLVRRASKAFGAPAFQSWLAENAARLTLVEGDIRELDRPRVEALLDHDGGLWHFAALTSLTAGDEALAREIAAVNLGGTRRLVEAAAQRPGGAPFFHVSTAYVAGRRQGTVREDEDRMHQDFRNPYEASKLESELAVQHGFAQGMTGAIFRPSVVVDDEGGTGGFKMVDACAYAVALAAQRGEPFIFRLPPEASINLVHSEWVIAAMIDLARMNRRPPATYHLTAPQATPLRAIAAILEGLVAERMRFDPDLPRTDLPAASRIFDKAIADLRPYFEAGVVFDRTNTERDLSPGLAVPPMDLASFVRSRLEAELRRSGRRRSERAARRSGAPA
jgi:long-chain acyl-CoA synthetase